MDCSRGWCMGNMDHKEVVAIQAIQCWKVHLDRLDCLLVVVLVVVIPLFESVTT